VILRTVPRRPLLEVLADPPSGTLSSASPPQRIRRPQRPPGFSQTGWEPARIAYFSMEFMVSEALPIYAGGLGNVAGEPLKALWLRVPLGREVGALGASPSCKFR
jgi:starch phosphorylase